MRRYDDAVAAALPEVAGLLAVLFVGLTVLDPVVLDGDTAVVMTTCAAVSALLFAVGFVWVSRSGVPRGWGHGLTAALSLVVAGNVLVHLGLTSELWQTSNLLLVVVGLGSGLLDPRWFAAVVASCWLGWAAVVTAFAADEPLLLHWVAGMAVATLLAVVVNSARRRSLDALDDARASAEDAAVHDVLTGLLNRRGLELLGRPIVASARRAGNAVSAVFVDVDGLKAVNDAGGHVAGDSVLAAVADGLRHVVRAGDLVARWGGDEFVVVGQGPGMPPLDLERRLKDWIAAEPPSRTRSGRRPSAPVPPCSLRGTTATSTPCSPRRTGRCTVAARCAATSPSTGSVAPGQLTSGPASAGVPRLLEAQRPPASACHDGSPHDEEGLA